MALDFIIVSPPYTDKSAGIMVLHDLCSTLNLLNYKAGILFISSGSQENQDFKFAYSNNKDLLNPNGIYYDYISEKNASEIAKNIQNSCVIYPDIIVGNPLGASKFSTYVLGIPKTKVSSEFVITYFSIFYEKYDYLLCKPFISNEIHERGSQHWTQRTLNLTYIGKGINIPNSKIIPGTLLLERNWPSDKPQLGILLRSCKYFFTWDFSGTNLDAVVSGALPVLIKDNYMPIEKINNTEFGCFPIIDIDELDDFRFNPKNINYIDECLMQMKNKLKYYTENWTQQVAGLAIKLKSF